MNRVFSKDAPLVVAMLVGLALVGLPAFAGDIEGTWRLVKRVLPDRTVLTPPAVYGMGTAINGTRHLNVFWLTPDGKPASYGVISKYRLTANTYMETTLASAFDDGSGGPIARGVNGEAKSVRSAAKADASPTNCPSIRLQWSTKVTH